MSDYPFFHELLNRLVESREVPRHWEWTGPSTVSLVGGDELEAFELTRSEWMRFHNERRRWMSEHSHDAAMQDGPYLKIEEPHLWGKPVRLQGGQHERTA